MSLKVTVCQMHNEREPFAQDWEQLVSHIRSEKSQFVLLPEMPFSPWFGTTPTSKWLNGKQPFRHMSVGSNACQNWLQPTF